MHTTNFKHFSQLVEIAYCNKCNITFITFIVHKSKPAISANVKNVVKFVVRETYMVAFLDIKLSFSAYS